MDQTNLDFYNTSYNDAGGKNVTDSKPVLDGETLASAYLSRQGSNLHLRTEALRKAVDDLALAARLDRATIIADADNGGGKLTFAASGSDYYFTTDSDMYIVPATSLAGDPPSGASIAEIPATYRYDDGAGAKFDLVAKASIRASGGNNRLFLRIFTGTSGAVTATVEPSGATPSTLQEEPVTLTVELPAAGATLNDVVNALVNAANPTVQFLDTSASAVVAGGSTQVNDVARVRFSGGHAPESMAGVDATGYKITSADFVAFFDISGTPNLMSEGDSLVLDFGSTSARAEATLADNMVAYLRIIRNNTVNTGKNNVVPIAKVFDGALILANNVMVRKDETRGFTVTGGSDYPLYKNVSNRPFVVVDANGYGDYTSIASAVAALSGSSIVFIRNGTYNEQILLPSDKSIHFIGESRAGVIIGSSADSTLVDGTAASYSHDFIFEHITFKSGYNAAAMISLDTYQSSEQYSTVFNDCAFLKMAETSYPLFDLVRHSVKCSGCYFGGAGYDSGDQVFKLTGSVNDQVIEVMNSYITEFGAVIYSGAATLKRAVFSNITVKDCGQNDASKLDYLFHLGGGTRHGVIEHVDYRNTYADGGALAVFVGATDNFTIQHCHFNTNVTDITPLGSSDAVFRVIDTAEISHCDINTGVARLGYFAGITFTYNSVSTAPSGTAPAEWVHFSGIGVPVLRNNYFVVYNMSGVDTLFAAQLRPIFEDNKIEVYVSAVTVIKAYFHAVIKGNNFRYLGSDPTAADSVGIEIKDAEVEIINNLFRAFGRAVYVTETTAIKCRVDGNRFENDNTMNYFTPINFSDTVFTGSAEMYWSICDNIMTGAGRDHCIGLYLASLSSKYIRKIACHGNHFSGFTGSGSVDWAPDAPGNNDVGLGKMGVDADMAHNLYENGVV